MRCIPNVTRDFKNKKLTSIIGSKINCNERVSEEVAQIDVAQFARQ